MASRARNAVIACAIALYAVVTIPSVRANPPPPVNHARSKTLRLSGAILLSIGIVASSIGTSLYARSWLPAGIHRDCDEGCPNQPLRNAGASLAAIGGPLVGGGIALLSVGWSL